MATGGCALGQKGGSACPVPRMPPSFRHWERSGGITFFWRCDAGLFLCQQGEDGFLTLPLAFCSLYTSSVHASSKNLNSVSCLMLK